MPLETLPTLQDLEITGTAGSQHAEAQYEPVETDELPTQHFDPSTGQDQSSQVLSFEQPHTSPFYPPPLNPFGFDSNSAIPIDPGLLDAHLGHPAPPGPDGGGGTAFHQSPWMGQPPNALNMDNYMVSPTSLPQYDSSVPLVPGISSFEPMVSTAWSMDSSLPSTSASRGPTMSSSMSVRGTSTSASSQSPSSPRKVSACMVEPPAASNEALPIHLGMQTEPRADMQPSKKRRQASGPKAPPKTIAEKRSHRTNSVPGLTSPPVPIAPATSPVATTVADDSKKNNNNKTKGASSRGSSSSTSSNREQTTMTTTTTKTTPTTTTTTSTAPSGLTQPGSSSSSQPTRPLAQQPQPTQPDPRARNREAANRCRAKSKVAVAELEATERAMGAEHQALTLTARSLRDEVLDLKNQLLMHGNCGDELIQQYLTNSARLVGSGVLGPGATTTTAVGAMPLVTGVQPPGPPPPLVIPPGVGGGGGGSSSSSSRGMPSASPPGVLPSSSVPSAGTTAARGHEKGSGGRRQ